MNLDRYQQAWNSEEMHPQVRFNADSLSREVGVSQEAFGAIIFWRDAREVGTALFMAFVFLAMGIAASLPWTWYLTIPAMLWIAGFMLVDRRLQSRISSPPEGPLLFYVKESLTQVEHQIWLLKNVFWWYLLPPSVSIMAFFVQVSWETSKSWWGCLILSGISGGFLFLLYRWVYRINQKAVREQLVPRRDKLMELIKYLEADTNLEDAEKVASLTSSLSDTSHNGGLNSNHGNWAENWNRIIPSWHHAALVIIPTLIGGYLGFQFSLPDMGSVFFQSVICAVLPFEIVFFSLWYLSAQCHKGQAVTSTGKSQLGAPAIFILVLLLVISALAFAALFSFMKHPPAQGRATTASVTCASHCKPICNSPCKSSI